ncbi:MAG: hypothetical protein AB1486_16870 [Planctomycetota bacterium]
MLKNAIYSLIPLAVMLLAAEGILTVLGAGSSPATLSRGFDPGVAYIVPDSSRPGFFQTQMFDGQRREVVIPPRDGRIRVLLFGGSNTESFYGDRLEQSLNRLRTPGSPEFEVINLGRRGYGSARVAILFRQAMCLHPDLAVIYCGHNEFVELGFFEDVEAQLSPGLRVAAGLLSNLRSFNVLVDGIRRLGSGSDTPERWTDEYERFTHFTFKETLAQLELYRENLTHICREAKSHGVQLLLCTVVSNMLSAPFASNLPADIPPDRAAELASLLQEVEGLIPSRFAPLVPRDPRDRITFRDWAPAFWDAAEREGRPKRLRSFLDTVKLFHGRVLSGAEEKDLERARLLLHDVLEICPDHPLALFELAMCSYLLREDQVASEQFALAARYDRAPRKGSDLTNEIVTETATAEGVALLDAARVFRAHSPAGIVGWDLMKDECHLQRFGLLMLMDDLARAILGMRERPR